MAIRFPVIVLLGIFFICGLASAQDTEEITLSTYYPAPYGEYDELFSERLLVWRPDADEMADMNEGDCHIGWSMIVGAGGTGFSYDELQVTGDQPGDGTALIKDRLGIGTTNPRSKFEVDQVNTGYGLHLDLVDAFQDALILHNGYYDSGWIDGALQLRWPMAHGFFGSRGIMMSAIQDTGGIIFFADSVATVADAAFTPTERMRITNAGNVGIGTMAPLANLHVGGSNAKIRVDSGIDAGTAALEMANYPTARVKTAILSKATSSWGRGDMYFVLDSVADDNAYDSTTDTKMVILNNGNVGIGTTSPVSRLQVQETNAATLTINSLTYTGGANGFQLIQQTSGRADLKNSGRTAMSIATGGNVGIGTTSPTQALHVVGNAYKTVGGTVWASSSDIRLKKDILPIENALDTVMKLKGITYMWKDPSKHGGENGRYMGFNAQDVEKVIPGWIKEDDVEGYKLINPVGADALFAEAIKELKAENDALKEKIELLEAKIEKLEVEKS